MVPVLVLISNVLGVGIFIAGITLWVRFDQQGKTRRRELEHAERMRALELGRPLDDAAVARYKALGAIGVAVPIVSLSAAAVATLFLLMPKELDGLAFILASVWGACLLICLTTVPAVLVRLREPPPGPLAGPTAHTGITTSRNTGSSP